MKKHYKIILVPCTYLIRPKELWVPSEVMLRRRVNNIYTFHARHGALSACRRLHAFFLVC